MALSSHVQTITAALPWRRPLPRDVRVDEHELSLDGGGHLVAVGMWQPRPAPAAVVLHGVAGSSDDAYVVRAAHELSRAGYHVLRLNQRGSGRGMGCAPRLYHAGLGDDLAVACRFLDSHDDVTASAALGFSLGGHLALCHAAAVGERRAPAGKLGALVAVSSPLDLSDTMRSFHALRGTPAVLYETLMVRSLVDKARALLQSFPHAPIDRAALRRVRTLEEFDAAVTVPCNDYADVADYHARASVKARLPQVTLPTLLVHAEDDPVCPVGSVRDAVVSPAVERVITARGGHTGFVEGLGQLWGRNGAVARAVDFFARHLPRV